MRIERVDESIYVIDDFLTKAEESEIKFYSREKCGGITGQTMRLYPL